MRGRMLLRQLVMLVLVLGLYTITAFASNQVTEIDVVAVIQGDGSMDITQTWTGTFTEGTENYIPMDLDSDMTLSNLQVTSQGRPFETVDDWDIDWSFSEKAYRCGINQSGGVFELCYGISDYGEQTYVISYTLANVITGYSDYDAMNFRFVNDEMNTTPTAVTVELSLADGTLFTAAMAEIWAFGFDGEVEFKSGNVVAQTQQDITFNEYVTVMLAIEKGILSPLRTDSGSFETMKTQAMEGSDYDEDEVPQSNAMLATALTATSRFLYITGFFLQLLLPSLLIFAFVFLRVGWRHYHRFQLKKFAQNVPYFRDIPNGEDLNMTYALGRMYGLCDEGSILGARILRLIDQDCLTPIKEEQVTFFGRTKEMVSLRLDGCQYGRVKDIDAQLYRILEEAAGEDKVLQSKELETFLKKQDRVLRNFTTTCNTYGRVSLKEKNGLSERRGQGPLLHLTPQGQEELAELIGFKRYLEDFTLLAERGVTELPLWKEMLTYAMLFGLADQLAEEMAELYPDMAPKVKRYRNSMTTAYAYHCTLYASMRRAEKRRSSSSGGGSRSSGGGGRSSRSGGGGSRGGKSGGGSR